MKHGSERPGETQDFHVSSRSTRQHQAGLSTKDTKGHEDQEDTPETGSVCQWSAWLIDSSLIHSSCPFVSFVDDLVFPCRVQRGVSFSRCEKHSFLPESVFHPCFIRGF